MYNGCTDIDEISKAVRKGLIDPCDVEEYQRITHSLGILKKGLDQEALTGMQYVLALSSTDKCSFEKSNEGGRLRYKLKVIKGEQPSDQLKKSMETTGHTKSG